MPMSSTFTAPERRKKVTTYGKPGRLASASSFFGDAPSPERPRKQAKATTYAAVRKPAAPLEIQSTLNRNRARQSTSPAPLDVFDVPSDNEAASTRSQPPPVVSRRKIPPKSDDLNVFDILSSDDEETKPIRKPKPHIPSGRTGKLKDAPPLAHTKTVQGRNGTTISSAKEKPTSTAVAPKCAKTPQLPQERSCGDHKQATTRTTRSRGTTPALLNPTSQVKPRQPTSTSNTKLVAKPTATEEFSSVDVFDVPMWDENVPSKTPVRRRITPAVPRNAKVATKPSQAPLSPSPSVDSDVSHKSNKRKRRASVSSSATIKAPTVEQKKKSLESQRKKKQQKTIANAPSALPPVPAARSNRPVTKISGDVTTHQTKRTRIQTAPALSRAPVVKGQSSPAKLHTMLVHRTAQKHPLAWHEFSATKGNDMNDDTMCEPQDETSPQKLNQKTPVPGSVTPRQQVLFNNLLGDSSESATPMPKISALKLSERKTNPAMSSLMRSSSDIPQSAYTRKSRLLDVLKRTASSSDEESETDEETEEEIISIPQSCPPADNSTGTKLQSLQPSTDILDAMDIDIEPARDSQNSQTTVHLHTGGRITYAKNRSYLEEAEPDLANLLDNMNDDLGLGSPKNQELTSDDDGEMGQLIGIHDLRRQGQQQKFQTQAEAMIDDVCGKGMNASQRRSAMMECATHMHDKDYVSQLLESSLMSSLLQSICSNGEIIFDFAAATAMLFILESRPGYAVLEQIHRSPIMDTLNLLLASKFSNLDIHRISRERKVNMAPRARETVAEFRNLIVNSDVWHARKPEKVSPQLVAIKALELLTVQLRQSGNGESLVDQSIIVRVLDVASACCTRISTAKAISQDYLTLEASLSFLESLSISTERQLTWPVAILTRLADMLPVIFETEDSPTGTQLAIRLCINVTNDRPKICQLFSKPTLVLPLLRSISRDFTLLVDETDEKRRNGIMENLIFSLGAMMNLTESSKQARISAMQDGGSVVDELVKMFLKGSELADQVCISSSPMLHKVTRGTETDI